ncbi:hypothetical protein [Streptomyces sp. NBC_00996]|uniref:hypothetical protein n=1 Tax=Streptomyces sp. NBC_00996 TaxID=2903710 RepID=UPI00386463B2|nr:hypothetical protein OG390_17690 [Streptomyces sp. NBC_00996]
MSAGELVRVDPFAHVDARVPGARNCPRPAVERAEAADGWEQLARPAADNLRRARDRRGGAASAPFREDPVRATGGGRTWGQRVLVWDGLRP